MQFTFIMLVASLLFEILILYWPVSLELFLSQPPHQAWVLGTFRNYCFQGLIAGFV